MENISRKLKVIYGDVTLGIRGEDFHYIFSYATGGPESFSIKGMEWLYRTPRPTFWRATTDNDRGNGFPLRSAMWMGADMFLSCTHISVCVDGRKITLPDAPENNRYTAEEYAETVSLAFTYETITVPSTTVRVTYEVGAGGRICVKAEYRGKKDLPQLPVFGMRFVMPTKAVGYRYEGLSGETYPDRKAGGVKGIYEVKGLPVTPYLVPQECGMHMDTHWVEVYRDTTLCNSYKGQETGCLKFIQDDRKFAFSCLPYTAEELENATHQEELPPERRTVLCILGAVRGVGGIDSWGSDVEPAYRIYSEEDISLSFTIDF